MGQKHKFYKVDKDKNVWINKEYLVQLNITGKCPVKCDFCYMKEHSNNRLELSDIELLWNNLRTYSRGKQIEYRVNLTGGDIFFHPKWKEIARFIANEETITAVDPLINKFWNEEQKELLQILKKKINFVQFNSDIVSESDIKAVQDIGKEVVLKISLYDGDKKRNIQKLKRLADKFSNVIISIDLIIPQKGACIEKKKYLFDNFPKLLDRVKELKKIFGDKLWLLSTVVKRELYKSIYMCPIPFGGVYVMPDGKIVPCSRYSHLDTGFTIKNFDLMEYVTKYSKLVSNYCLCENKYFNEFWEESENPKNFSEEV